MQEDFTSDRSFHVIHSAGKCPFIAGHVRPYHNMRSRTSLDPATFGSTSVGSTAGSIKEGGTNSTLDERSFIRYKTGLRGGDIDTNTGVETFQNTTHTNSPWIGPKSYGSVIGSGSPSYLMNRPLNISGRQLDHFSQAPHMFT